MESESTPLYHYTSVDTLRSIVCGNPPCLHLSNVFYMNDRAECSWLHHLVLTELLSKEELNSLPFWKRVRHFIESRTVEDIFCVCFSHRSDSLSQWARYADNGAGVAIGLDPAYLRSVEQCQLQSMVYDPREHRRMLADCMRPFPETEELKTDEARANYFCGRLWVEALRCKNPGFVEEEETRWVHADLGPYGNALGPLQYKTRNSMLVPYVCAPLDKKAILEITFGPRMPAENEASIKRMVEQHGCYGVKFSKSISTFRV